MTAAGIDDYAGFADTVLAKIRDVSHRSEPMLATWTYAVLLSCMLVRLDETSHSVRNEPTPRTQRLAGAIFGKLLQHLEKSGSTLSDSESSQVADFFNDLLPEAFDIVAEVTSSPDLDLGAGAERIFAALEGLLEFRGEALRMAMALDMIMSAMIWGTPPATYEYAEVASEEEAAAIAKIQP